MSATYNLEPNPTGKVILQTTAGDILVELFAKQTPLTSRNFLQLCLDGYFDNTIFHRIIPGFIAQAGDPTGTGHGGESSYGEPFADEFHSRLKYNRRGLLGMANTGEKNDNGSQFFLTLGHTPELTGKNTMFGRIQGDTIYNLMKIGDAELAEDGSERPLYPTKITGTEILVNPFEDMVKRERIAQRTTDEAGKKEKKKPKRKAGKAMLSFGDDEGAEEDTAPVMKKKPKFNPKLVSVGEEKPEKRNNTAMPKGPVSAKPSERQSPKPEKPRTKSPPPRSASPVRAKSSSSAPKKEALKPIVPTRSSRSPSSSPEPAKTKTDVERTNAEIEALKASMRRGEDTSKKEKPKSKSTLEEMIPSNSIRGRKRKGPANPKDEQQTLDILAAFRQKLDAAHAAAPNEPAEKPTDAPEAKDEGNGDVPVESKAQAKPEESNNTIANAVEEEEHLCDLHFIANCQSCGAWDKDDKAEEEDDNDIGWMSHSLSFAKDRLGKDLEWKRKNEEELVVIDPREKAKDIKMEQKKKKGGDDGGKWERGKL